MKKILLLTAAITAFSCAAQADDKKLSTHGVLELSTLVATSLNSSADYFAVYDASADDMVKVLVPSTFLTAPATAGTVEASKTVVVDANKDISSFRNLGLSGTLTDTRAPSADSATTNKGIAVNFTAPVDTTGTNIHNALDVAFTISNATGGTNSANGLFFGNVTGDAQVNVTAVKIGTGTVLGTSQAIVVGSGWDAGLNAAVNPAIDSGQTVYGADYDLTVPANTTGTNTMTGSNVDLVVGNATGGTNVVNGWNFSNYTGDAQVDVNAINIGTSDGLGTATAIKVGTGWDVGLQLDSGLKINSTNGTAVTAFRFAFDAVANGQTSKTTTLTGATASSRCVASAAETATNAVYIRSVVPGTDQVVITTSGDPGASNMDYTVICLN